MAEEQQFCLRWNNFHANITSQFEALRDEEDFVDVTLACDGQRLKAHKVVLSACSPYFKELFKSNPCKHPILFLRDVEFSHLQSLVEFMYAGEVNVAQAQLSSFLHTAESLQIRGLTEAPQRHKHLYRHQAPSEPSSPTTPNQELSTPTCDRRVNPHRSKPGADDLDEEDEEEVLCLSPSLSPPPAKRACQDRVVREEGQDEEGSDHQTNSRQQTGLSYQHGILRHELEAYRDDPVEMLEPKLEIPDYASDGECKADNGGVTSSFLGLENSMDTNNSLSSLHGGMDVLPGTSAQNFMSDISQESSQADLRKLHSLDPRPCPICFRMYSNLSNLRQHVRLIHNPQTVACPLCNKPFKTKLYLKRHLMSFHELVCSSAATNGSPKSQGQQHPDLYPPPTPSQGFPGVNNNPLGGGEEKSSKFSAMSPHKTKETLGQAEEYFQNSRIYQIPLSLHGSNSINNNNNNNNNNNSEKLNFSVNQKCLNSQEMQFHNSHLQSKEERANFLPSITSQTQDKSLYQSHQFFSNKNNNISSMTGPLPGKNHDYSNPVALSTKPQDVSSYQCQMTAVSKNNEISFLNNTHHSRNSVKSPLTPHSSTGESHMTHFLDQQSESKPDKASALLSLDHGKNNNPSYLNSGVNLNNQVKSSQGGVAENQ